MQLACNVSPDHYEMVTLQAITAVFLMLRKLDDLIAYCILVKQKGQEIFKNLEDLILIEDEKIPVLEIFSRFVQDEKCVTTFLNFSRFFRNMVTNPPIKVLPTRLVNVCFVF